MIERGKAMEIAVNTNILIEQPRRQDALIYSLESNSCCVLSNVQFVAVNSWYNGSYSNSRLIFSIEVFFELLSCCARWNVLDPEC